MALEPVLVGLIILLGGALVMLAGWAALLSRRLSRARGEIDALIVGMAQAQDKVLRDQLHGFRNALQTISALIGLQRDAHKSDPVRQEFDAALGRLGAVGRFYQARASQAGSIAVDEIVRAVLADCQMKHDPQSRVALTLELAAIHLPLDRAIPLAILLHEAATNAFRHAFAATARPTLLVRLTEHPGGDAELSVVDNGSGMAEPPVERLGMRIIKAFSRQLAAQTVWHVRQNENGGTSLSVTFRPNP